MKITYAICVCNESKELYSLIAFLKKVKDLGDEINILVDTAHVSPQVLKVIEFFQNDIVVHERFFDGNFSEHRNYHLSKCTGDYIVVIDADEMPQEKLIKNIRKIIQESDSELIYVPRINIQPGSTQEWLDTCKFRTNELGWVNWPDYSPRILKNSPSVRYVKALHEDVSCTGKKIGLPADPSIALWHIKSVEKQDNRWDANGAYVSPTSAPDLYDSLM